MNDKQFMKIAYAEAQKAYKQKECPVAAVLVKNGIIISRASNRETKLFDPTAHAEILVLRKAGKRLKKHTFRDCIIYTTLRPCPMCENSMLRAKIPKVIYGSRSFNYIYKNDFSPSHIVEEGPIMEKKCKEIFVKWAKKKGLITLLESDLV